MPAGPGVVEDDANAVQMHRAMRLHAHELALCRQQDLNAIWRRQRQELQQAEDLVGTLKAGRRKVDKEALNNNNGMVCLHMENALQQMNTSHTDAGVNRVAQPLFSGPGFVLEQRRTPSTRDYL
eukprot:CAMPEP_0172913992 /NCGR_PEP_ID=MMETSP1075-20121228/191488_1 /TAXON_ID=2916 /ORGANISM="Ceratium fusus, Strain PA161109" /LENGTH=123 /DNA_ID=CAMNT_0013772821 /DNA_START=78 /DNA_END=446 /DNA_ORIENTATION=+